MESVVLIIHLILALSLIGVVLLQRSEGGGLGMGGGGAATGRPGPTALGKVTWGISLAFVASSLALTIIAAESSSSSSVTDSTPIEAPADTTAPAETVPAAPEGLGGGDLLPPAAGDAGPVVPDAD